MAQCLRELAGPLADLGLTSRPTWWFTTVNNSSPGHLTPSSDLCGPQTYTVHTHSCRQNPHIHKVKESEKDRKEMRFFYMKCLYVNGVHLEYTRVL